MRLAVTLRNNVGGDIYQLILPQKSLFGQGDVDHMPFLQYAKYVAQSGYNLNMLATRMTFDTDSDFPKLTFSNAEFLDKETYDTAIEQGESPIAVSAGKLNFTKKDGPSLPKMIAPPGSAAAEIAAPVKREEKPKTIAAKAPSKSGLSTLVDEWGDDK
jgi:hypothetical protein